MVATGNLARITALLRSAAGTFWGLLSAANARASSFVEKQIRRIGCQAVWVPRFSKWAMPVCTGLVLLILAVSTDPIALFAAPPRPVMSFDDALSNGNVDEIRSQLYWGHDVNAKGQSDRTPLITAVMLNEEKLVEVLLENGADVDAFETQGKTALHMAVMLGSTAMIEMLLERGTDINAVHRRMDAPPDLQDFLSVTPLQLAVLENPQLVEFLLKHGADVNGRNLAGITPLEMATRFRKQEAATLLRQHGGQ